MPFIGNKPSAVPLTSADIADGIITSAKIVDATITNSDVASSIITGQTAETSIAGGDSVLIYDDSASALRKMTRTNFVAGVGGDNTPAFQASMSANQTIAANTYVKINFDTEDYDIGGCYNNTSGTVTLNSISTPSYSFAPNTAGKYLITAAINSQTSTDFDAFIASVFKNGTQVSRAINSNRHFDTAFITFIVTANGTSDYFDIRGYTEQSGGSSLASLDGAIFLAWFNAVKLIGV